MFNINSYNIGFIGCGNIAHFHIAVLKELNQNIVAVSARKNSPNIVPFSNKYGINRKYTDWQKMVENERIDALWVMASWSEMDKLLIPLIKTGLPLFLEKPVALSSKKIKEAITEHEKTGQYIQVGYNRRFYPFIDEIKSTIKKSKLRSIIVEIPESIDLKNIELAQKLWLMNSSHMIDLILFFVGDLNIKYKNNLVLSNDEIPSSYNAILETEQGVPVHLSAEWNTANNFGITFLVDNKRIVLKPLEKTTIYKGFDIVEPTKQSPLRQYLPKKISEYCCNGKFKPGFYEQAEYFLRQLNSNSLNSKHSDLEACFSTSLLIEELSSKNLKNKRNISYAK